MHYCTTRGNLYNTLLPHCVHVYDGRNGSKSVTSSLVCCGISYEFYHSTQNPTGSGWNENLFSIINIKKFNIAHNLEYWLTDTHTQKSQQSGLRRVCQPRVCKENKLVYIAFGHSHYMSTIHLHCDGYKICQNAFEAEMFCSSLKQTTHIAYRITTKRRTAGYGYWTRLKLAQIVVKRQSLYEEQCLIRWN